MVRRLTRENMMCETGGESPINYESVILGFKALFSMNLLAIKQPHPQVLLRILLMYLFCTIKYQEIIGDVVLA